MFPSWVRQTARDQNKQNVEGGVGGGGGVSSEIEKHNLMWSDLISSNVFAEWFI